MKNLNRYKVLTITHKNTNLNNLGRYSINLTGDESLKDKIAEIKQVFDIPEMIYLATCNRILFFFTSDFSINTAFINKFFLFVNGNYPSELNGELIQSFEGQNAMNHLYQVAGSIDSLVVGEREILRQLREAYQMCYDWNFTGDALRIAMQSIVQTAKEIYAKTRIGEKPISVVSLAMNTLRSSPLPEQPRILLVGAGQTNVLVSKFLLKYDMTNVIVFNRSISNGQTLANRFGTLARPLSELDHYDAGFDVIIICTGSTESIITQKNYAQLLNGESGKKVIIDLSVPFNVDKSLQENYNINLIEVEGLREMAKTNMKFREKEVVIAKSMIEDKIVDFGYSVQERQIEIALKDIPKEIKQIKSHAINSVFKKEFDQLDDEAKELMEKMLSYMEKKCISIPMKTAKRAVLPTK